MKLDLRSKLLISYLAIILITLALLGWLVDSQVNQHFHRFYDEIIINGIPMPPRPNNDLFLDAVQRSISLTILGAGVLAVFISLIFSEVITKPIKKLIEATEAIAQGKYEKRVPIESSDELGDLTRSLNSMAKALQDHRYLQEQLIVNVSHELATPLTNIGGYLEALSDHVIPQRKQTATYTLMKEEVDRLKNMLDEVRTLSMLEQSQFKIQTKPVDAKALTQKILKQIEPQFKEKEIPLKFKADLTTKDFNLDKDRYTQILLNLLSNALHYSSKGNPVEVRLNQSTKGLHVDIEDHGQGIPEKELPYIFERFYRADKSRNRKTGGLGVGLSIVKELVEAHGGHISVTSTEGEGTTFSLTLPQ